MFENLFLLHSNFNKHGKTYFYLFIYKNPTVKQTSTFFKSIIETENVFMKIVKNTNTLDPHIYINFSKG